MRAVETCRKTRRTVQVAASPTELKDCAITPLDAKPVCQFNEVWSPGTQDVTLLIFFTHWADLGSWELAQRLVEVLPEIQAKGVPFRTTAQDQRVDAD